MVPWPEVLGGSFADSRIFASTKGVILAYATIIPKGANMKAPRHHRTELLFTNTASTANSQIFISANIKPNRINQLPKVCNESGSEPTLIVYAIMTIVKMMHTIRSQNVAL
jgi:hypothetical protein